MEITYENIKPLIKKEVAQGSQIQLEFQAKNQDAPLTTVAVVVPNTKEITKNIGKEAVKSTVKTTVKRGVINGILNAIGLGGLLGSTVRRAANEVSRGKSSKNIANFKISEKDKKEAIVKAFEPFATMYKFNEQNSEWEYIQK